MISPPDKADIYPGRLPPLRQQWQKLALGLRVAVIVVPLVVVVVLLAVSVRVGATAAILAVGVAAATAVFVKNRTDRHNAAIDNGEISVPTDPHLRAVGVEELPPGILEGAAEWGVGSPAGVLGPLARFDGGWLLKNKSPRDLAVVAGDDGGWARFDPRRVPDLWAAAEYLAGRGRER